MILLNPFYRIVYAMRLLSALITFVALFALGIAPKTAQGQLAADSISAERDASALPVVDASAKAANDTVSDAAVVMPGDRIRLAVWREPDWSGQWEIDERGMVTLPRIGPTHVADRPVNEIRELLTERYGEFLQTPAVEVVVLRRIGVHGEVRAPTLYWVDLTMTLRDAIAMAGGLTPSGDPNRIVVERGGERLSFTEAETAAALTAGLESGDHIVIGRRSWMSLNAPLVISTAVSVASILAGFVLAR